MIQMLPNETAVKILAEVDEWLYVSALGKTGYIARDFVLRHKPDEGEVPEEERDFLRDDEEPTLYRHYCRRQNPNSPWSLISEFLEICPVSSLLSHQLSRYLPQWVSNFYN